MQKRNLFFMMTMVVLCQLLRRSTSSFHRQHLPRRHQKRQQFPQFQLCATTSTSDIRSHVYLNQYDIDNVDIWKKNVNTSSFPGDATTTTTTTQNSIISNLLVCGDGDLSFSASIAKILAEFNIKLIATVLEEQHLHRDVYQRSQMNEEIILSYPEHEVKYGIDATKLEEYFSSSLFTKKYNQHNDDNNTKNIFKFDRIQFNFPHWRGKANHRYNRQLIDAFFQSASKVLSDDGEIHMALCEGQGGSNSQNLKGYRDTWTPAFFASHHGLMLMDILPFSPSYNLSSHRGVDRGFRIGKTPEMYVFAKPNKNQSVRRKDQIMCCRHELHVILPENYDQDYAHNGLSQYALTDIIEGDAVCHIIDSVVPDGITVEVPERKYLSKSTTGYDFDMIIFLVVYCGETKLLTREDADLYRHNGECEVNKYIRLRENRRGRLVSRPFPYYLLQSIIDDHNK